MSKDPEFNALELRRTLMDLERHCDTVIGNLGRMKPSEAGRYAVGAVRMLRDLAAKGLRKQPEQASHNGGTE